MHMHAYIGEFLWVCMCVCVWILHPTQGEFVRRVTFVRERLLQREQEVTGEWLTEERMKSKHGWSKRPFCNPVCSSAGCMGELRMALYVKC